VAVAATADTAMQIAAVAA
ncbi:hypothetical protein A2U01_0060947, partial [Trifolium medium]|nr:hypothetical protein [Trifolium medium]